MLRWLRRWLDRDPFYSQFTLCPLCGWIGKNAHECPGRVPLSARHLNMLADFAKGGAKVLSGDPHA